jgi:hypothetical protein
MTNRPEELPGSRANTNRPGSPTFVPQQHGSDNLLSSMLAH